MIAVGAGLALQGDFPIFLKLVPPTSMFCFYLFRYITWVRRRGLVLDAAQARVQLRRVVWLTVLLMGAGSLWAVEGFLQTSESSRALAVVFISLAAFACANCLASLPSASILSLAIGLGPISVAMLVSDDLRMVALGASVIAVALLHMRLVISQFGETARNLTLQAELEIHANTDALTSLLNRRAFGRILDERIASHARDEEFVVAMLDLDGFKPVNDRLGHAAGDNLLVLFAERLRAICAPGDPVARIGGDEFAIIFGDPKGRVAVERRIAAMTSALAEPYCFDGQHVYVPASIGTARFPQVANTAAGLLDAADASLYAAKSRENRGQAKVAERVSRHATKRAA